MRTLAIVQARMGSTRLPNKVMLPINGVPLIELLLHRLALAKRIDHIIVATSNAHGDKPLAAHVRGLGYEVFEGSEINVLERFYQAAKAHEPEVVVRITGDCPLVDPELVDAMIAFFVTQEVDYLSNGNPPTFPDGLVQRCLPTVRWSKLSGMPLRRMNASTSLPSCAKVDYLPPPISPTMKICRKSAGQWTKRRTLRWSSMCLITSVRVLILDGQR